MADLPTYDVHVRPAHYNANDGAASGYNAVWLRHNSPTTTPAVAGTSSPDGRYILAPWSVVSGIKSRVWWFAYEVWIDPAWDTSLQGDWGTGAVPNFHNHARDEESIGWVWGAGTSSYQNDYIGGTMAIHLEHSSFPRSSFPYYTGLPKNQWHSFVFELTLGRTDIRSYTNSQGTFAVGDGRVRGWINGGNTPVDTGPTNTVQYATNPSTGHRILQGVMAEWDGFYTRNARQDDHLRFTPLRVGRTWAECRDDTPVFLEAELGTIFNPQAPGPNLGPSSYSLYSPTRTHATFLTPATLDGGSPPPTDPPPAPTSHYGVWSPVVRWNASPLSDPTPEPPTVVEEHLGPWAPAVGWNALSRDEQPAVGDAVSVNRTYGRRSLRRRLRDPLYT